MIGFREHGYATPASQAEYLQRHGCLLGVIGKTRYYEHNGQGYKVISPDGIIVAQVEKIKLEDAKTITKYNLKSGGI